MPEEAQTCRGCLEDARVTNFAGQDGNRLHLVARCRYVLEPLSKVSGVCLQSFVLYASLPYDVAPPREIVVVVAAT